MSKEMKELLEGAGSVIGKAQPKTQDRIIGLLEGISIGYECASKEGGDGDGKASDDSR